MLEIRNKEGYLDLMISLPTMNSKILFGILSKYTAQLDKVGSTHETSIDYLKYFFDESKVLTDKDGYVYSMNNNDLVSRIESSLDAINELIAIKNEAIGLHLKQYKVEWIREWTHAGDKKQGRLFRFKFSYKQEPKKQEQKKEQVKEDTVDGTVEPSKSVYGF